LFSEESHDFHAIQTRPGSIFQHRPDGHDFVVPSSDGFYLIGETENPQGPPTSFTVMRVTVLR